VKVAERKSKVIPLEEAAGWVKDGIKLSISGQHINNQPNAFVRELVRQGKKNLTIIPTNGSGYQVDILIGAGCVGKLFSCYCGLDYVGPAPNFRRFSEAGKLNTVELDELGLLQAVKAGEMGLNFFPLPNGIMACDNVKINPDWYKIIDDPYTGKKTVVVPPLRADVCVTHVAVCDAYGNGREGGFMEGVLYHAADKVIVTTDRICSLDETSAHYKEVTIYGDAVEAVVEVPWGAHPGGSQGAGYKEDEEHLRAYQKAGREDATFKQYLDTWVYGCKSHKEYLEKVGIGKLLQLRVK
jgi:glutaconate CoA-transferase, subunit A